MTLTEALATRLPLPDAHLDTIAGLAPQALIDALPALPHREYSMPRCPPMAGSNCSYAETRHDDGRLGLASGWLTVHAPEGRISRCACAPIARSIRLPMTAR